MNGAEQSRIEQNRTRFSRAEISFERLHKRQGIRKREAKLKNSRPSVQTKQLSGSKIDVISETSTRNVRLSSEREKSPSQCSSSRDNEAQEAQAQPNRIQKFSNRQEGHAMQNLSKPWMSN
eukprot:1159295-Pelagomonas_calceolata.AAC.8